MLRRMTWLGVVVCALLLTSGSAMAQRGGGGAGGAGGVGGGQGGQGGGGGGRRGGGDPAAQMQFTLENIQQSLGATDQEWSVLRPKVEKVVTARNEVQAANRGGRGGGGGRRGGGGGGNNPQPATTAVARALQDLQNTLANENATADQISQKLTALREAKAKAAITLAAAQKDLKELLTARQEAVLVTMGYLE